MLIDTMQRKNISYLDLFRNRDYTLLFIGQTISYGGDALSRVALPLYVYQTTGNIHALGGAFALQYIPWVLIGPVAGVIADRKNRKFLLVSAVWIEALSLVGVLYSQTAWLMLGFIFLGSMAQILKIYVRQAFMPDVVGLEYYSRAVSLNIITVQATDVVGVAVAGWVVALVGPRVAIWLDVLSFAVNSMFIFAAHIPQPQRIASAKIQIRQDLAEGLVFLFRNSMLIFIVVVLILRGLTMIGTFPLYVDFIERILNKGAFEFGLFTAAASLGYVLSSIMTVRLEKQFHPIPTLLISTALSGLFLLPFLVIRTFWILLMLRFLSALCYGMGNLIANVQIARLVPSELRGRVSGIAWSFVKLSQAISSSGLSMLAEAWGTPVVISISGLMLFLGTWALGLINSQRLAMMKRLVR